MIDDLVLAIETPTSKDSVSPGSMAIRHRLSTRIWHGINAAALLILLMSGLMIFNAHPRLYWGQYGANADAAWFEIGDKNGAGFLKVGDIRVATTGVLGVYTGADGLRTAHAFPHWATLPSRYNLADARIWHLAFAWVLSLALLFYMVRALWNGHIRRDLHITRAEWSLGHIWRDIKNHAMLRFPKGANSIQYNILQKLSYISVIFIAVPLMIFTGLTMSPAMNAAWPWLTEIFGGRQSARSLHFIATFFLVAFFVVHMTMVLVSGPYGQIRSMITGKLPRAR